VKVKENNIVITEDGYKFIVQSDGSLTDGDMTFANINELSKFVDTEMVKGE